MVVRARLQFGSTCLQFGSTSLQFSITSLQFSSTSLQFGGVSIQFGSTSFQLGSVGLQFDSTNTSPSPTNGNGGITIRRTRHFLWTLGLLGFPLDSSLLWEQQWLQSNSCSIVYKTK